ncbi:MAG: hypothetical protein PHR28_06030, partial [candidate division Zixibacteria bacterium]|nr:hypothetical protein [candidate division Zixibacteria bacterium]
MHRRILIVCILTTLLAALCVGPVLAKKPPAVAVRISNLEPTRVTPPGAPINLSLADTCIVNNGGPICYYIYPWIVGDELYKSYQDPSLSCTNPYPFTITEVLFPLYVPYYDATFQLSVDVEGVDLTTPSCPAPGDMLTISSLYEITLEPNLYMVYIPLDTPVTVTGPYFVGAYFSSSGNPYDVAVLSDSIPVSCVGYNDWGEGYVDLNDVYNDSTGEKIFPGRLMLYSSGTTGGTGTTEPAPAARLIVPSSGQLLGATVDLWADDAAGSKIIKQTQFHYQSGQSWISIDTDTDDDAPLRNGVAACNAGNGLSATWNTTSLSEADYAIRAIITDTLGRADTASVT